MADGNRLRAYLYAIGWTFAILLACSIPGRDIPNLGFDLFEYDKIVHFGLFLVFGWLWLRALPGHLTYRFVWLGLFGLAYGVATEIYQGLLPWERTPDPMDAIANILGLLVGFVVHEWTRVRRFTG